MMKEMTLIPPPRPFSRVEVPGWFSEIVDFTGLGPAVMGVDLASNGICGLMANPQKGLTHHEELLLLL